MITDWHFYAAAIPAVILMGLSKGGFAGIGAIGLPLLALALPPIQAAAIMLPILMLQDLVSVWAFRKEFDARNLKIIIPGGMIGIAVGGVLLTMITDAFVQLLVGLIAAGFVLYSWLRKGGLDAPAGQARTLPGLFWSAIAGFTSFMANAGQPPLQVFVLPQKLPPRIYAGTFTFFFFSVNIVKFIVFWALGQVSQGNLATSAVLFPLAFASTLGGVWLVRRIDSRPFYRIIYILTFVLGLKLIWDGARVYF